MVTMPGRIAKVGDLTAGMWEKAVSLDPLFDVLKVKRTLPKRSPRKGPPVDWRAPDGRGGGEQRGPRYRRPPARALGGGGGGARVRTRHRRRGGGARRVRAGTT